MIDKKIIQERFSKAAQSYDSCAFLQQRIAKELLAEIISGRNDYQAILDVGSGTGQFALDLNALYPSAKIFLLDIAQGMLNKARSKWGFFLIQADAEYFPLKNNQLDLVVSNLTYQWLCGLPAAFSEVGRVLAKGGEFYFSFFGKKTFLELGACINDKIGRQSLYLLPSRDIVYNALSGADFVYREARYSLEREFFPDFLSILRWLKLLGANYSGLRFPGLSARGAIKNIAHAYEKRFSDNGKVFLTLEKIIVKAKKK